MAITYVKEALVEGIGNGYVSVMLDEETFEYEPTVFEFPSLQKVNVKKEITEKQIVLSSKIHTNKTRINFYEITVDAGYLPSEFVAQVLGEDVVEPGAKFVNSNMSPKPFAFGFPATLDDGTKKLFWFSYCFLQPVDFSGSGDNTNEGETKQFVIKAWPRPDTNSINFEMDEKEAGAKYDVSKFFDQVIATKTDLAKLTATTFAIGTKKGDKE